MRKVNRKILAAACVFMMTLAQTAAADTHYVNPGQSIQAAIDAASNGDQIEVAPGTYNEAINFNGKAVQLYSSGGPDVTTIDATGLNSSVVTCNSTEETNTFLEGFTITGGNASHGGGIYNNDSNPTVTNCIFLNNTASSDGGGMYNFQSSPKVTNCTFSNNSAYWDGGGMYNLQSSPTVTNCTFSGNSASNGGGMNNWDNSNPTVTNCTFSSNLATSIGGGMENYPSSSPSVTNCTFSSNSAGTYGGGMDNWDNSNPTVTNCTFSGNSADAGSGMYNYSSSPTVINCILWGNTPDEIYDYFSTTTVTYSDVQAGWPDANNTNIDADPRFVDPNNTDPNLRSLRLKPDSPCIDAGDSTVLLAVPVYFDLDGKARYIDIDTIDDTGSGPWEFLDMGAYEFYCSGIPGDINCDGVVDFKDLAILCANWLAGTEPEL